MDPTPHSKSRISYKTHWLLAVHGVHPRLAVVLAERLQRVGHAGTALCRDVEAESLLDRLGHATHATCERHGV